MTTAHDDIRTIEAALATLGERAKADPAYRDELTENHVAALASAGVSALTLTESLAEAGATEDEVVAFGFEPLSFQSLDPGPSELKVSATCIGTCRRQTLWICGGCTNSFVAEPHPGV
jgi:hypothetical protein